MQTDIANLFASQRKNIAAALPSVFGILLRRTDLLNSLGDATLMATPTGSEAIQEASAIRPAAAARQHGADAAHASPNWLYWLLPITAVAALLIYFAATK